VDAFNKKLRQLLFTLGRMDIMPVDDFGVQAALMMADSRK